MGGGKRCGKAGGALVGQTKVTAWFQREAVAFRSEVLAEPQNASGSVRGKGHLLPRPFSLVDVRSFGTTH